MSDSPIPTQPSRPSRGGRFSAVRLAFWLPACAVGGAVAAWGGEIAQSYYAPWVILPLLVGIALGAMIVAPMRLEQVGHRPTILLGALLAVAIATVGQHYLLYRAVRNRVPGKTDAAHQAALQAFAQELEGRAAELPPTSFARFLRSQAEQGRRLLFGYVARGWAVWLSWAIDGLLVLLATLVVVWPASRLPYCNRCGSWYRTTRGGRIDGLTARRLAELIGVAPPEPHGTARYRLQNCLGGCGPTGFELRWEQSSGENVYFPAWIDAQQRHRVTEVLDRALAEHDETRMTQDKRSPTHE